MFYILKLEYAKIINIFSVIILILCSISNDDTQILNFPIENNLSSSKLETFLSGKYLLTFQVQIPYQVCFPFPKEQNWDFNWEGSGERWYRLKIVCFWCCSYKWMLIDLYQGKAAELGTFPDLWRQTWLPILSMFLGPLLIDFMPGQPTLTFLRVPRSYLTLRPRKTPQSTGPQIRNISKKQIALPRNASFCSKWSLQIKMLNHVTKKKNHMIWCVCSSNSSFAILMAMWIFLPAFVPWQKGSASQKGRVYISTFAAF